MYTPEHVWDCPLNEDLRLLPTTCRDEYWYVLNTRINLVMKHIIPGDKWVSAHPEDLKTRFYVDTLKFILGTLQAAVRKHERKLFYAPSKSEVAGEVENSPIRKPEWMKKILG
jgi:hypothetical protein